MDYKIYSIELVNRLLAWQHTAFNHIPVISLNISDKRRDFLSLTIQPESIEPLNVISLKATDFVLHHKICCFFSTPLPRCRSPPLLFEFPQNSDEMEEPAYAAKK